MVAEEKRLEDKGLPRLDGFYWAGALIWVGLVFGADSLGILPQIGGSDPWSWVFIGGGLGGLMLCYYATISSEYANPTTWEWAWGVIFLVLGVVGILSIVIPWWLILILIGTAVLYNAYRSR